MTTRKTAVDPKAKAYWSQYFGPYGKQWTDDVPHRVAKALAENIAKTASAATAETTRVGGAADPLQRAAVAPLGQGKTETGGLAFEGLFRGTSKTGAEVYRAFRAEFAPDGALLTLKAREA